MSLPILFGAWFVMPHAFWWIFPLWFAGHALKRKYNPEPTDFQWKWWVPPSKPGPDATPLEQFFHRESVYEERKAAYEFRMNLVSIFLFPVAASIITYELWRDLWQMTRAGQVLTKLPVPPPAKLVLPKRLQLQLDNPKPPPILVQQQIEQISRQTDTDDPFAFLNERFK